ncbi:MAG: hypothetical protein ACWGOY_15440, partial [Anaerolineales bacterium]
MSEKYWGYVYSNDKRAERILIADTAELLYFLKSHLYDAQLEITDARDNLVFRSLEGVDLYSNLGDIGIDLPAIYRELRDEIVANEEPDTYDREPWEDEYDRIGLSSGEIRMRQRVKAACKAARTIEEVAALLEGTYFGASFISEDKTRAWGYLDGQDFSVCLLQGSEEEGWGNAGNETVTLDREARV